QLLDDLVATHAGQHEVEDQQVRLRVDLERLQRGLARSHRLDLVALGLEQVAQQRRGVAIVLDDENARRLGGHRDITPVSAIVAATTRARSSGVYGLATYASHPAWNADSRSWGRASADTAMMGMFRVSGCWRRRRATSQPESPGNMRSSRMTAGGRSSASCTAASPSDEMMARPPSRSSAPARIRS